MFHNLALLTFNFKFNDDVEFLTTKSANARDTDREE